MTHPKSGLQRTTPRPLWWLVAFLIPWMEPASAADVISTWNGTTNNWTSNNWSSPLFPNNGNGGFTYDAVVNSGNVTLDQNIAIQKLTLGGSSATTITGVSNLTLNELWTWTNGTMAGTGETAIAASGSLAISGTAVGVVRTLGRTLINDGTANWTGNRGLTFSGGAFENNNSFTINSTSLLDAGGSGVFENAGTFTKQGSGLAQFTSGVVFNNTGLVDIQAGSLTLAAGGTHTGDFAIASGTTLTFNGTHNFEGTPDITGAGTFAISTGTTSFNGTTTVAGGLSLASSTATLSGSGTVSFGGASTWTNGTMSGTGQTTVASGGSLLLNPTAVGAFVQLNRTLVNNGSVTWTGTRAFGMNNGALQNNGSFTVSSGSLSADGPGVFHNSGTFTKQGSSITQFVNGLAFNNSGTVDVQGGTLRLHAGGTHTGNFSLAASTALDFVGTHIFEGTNAVSGTGIFRISTGTTSFNGATTVGALALDSTLANLSGTGTVTLSGASTWTNGTMSGTGQTTVASGGSLLLNPTAVGAVIQLNRMLVNNGSITWTGTRAIAMNNGTWQNNGSFTVNSTSLLDASGAVGANAFNNAGTFIKQGSGNTQFVNGGVFNNSGTVDIQAGSLILAAGGTHTGNFAIAAFRTLEFDGTHTFTGTNAITGAGTFALATTTTNFNGSTTVQAGLSLGSVLATLSGTGTVTLTGASTWTNGTMAGSGQTVVGAGGSLAISGAGAGVIHQLDRTLVNNNVVTWTGSHLTWNNGSFQNNASLSVSAPSGIDNFSTGGTNALHNAGTFTKSGAGLIWFHDGVAFNNSGTVDIQAGSLRLDAGGSHAGSFAVPTGTSLTMSGTHAFTATSNVTGAGTFSNLGTLDVQGGTLTVQPTVTQLSGTQLTSGTWKIQNNSTLNLTSGSSITTNFASVTISGAGSSFPKINSLVDNRGSLEILGGNQFTAAGAFSNMGIMTIGAGSQFTAASGINQSSGGTLRGSGTLVANVQNSGSIRPGNSPGILTIDGNLTQTATSVLEIEVGGLTAIPPNPLHDKVVVTGNAALGGRLDVPIINGFVPQVGTSIVFLTSPNVSGQFASVFSPNLETASPNVAIEVVPSATDVQLHFVAPLTNIQFDASTAAADWTIASTWDTGVEPDIRNIIEVQNLAGVDQRVNVESDDAFVHQLAVEGDTHTITLGVKNGRSLSAIVGTTIEDRAVIELGDGSTQGNLVSSTVTVEAGGLLAGNGMVKGNLVVGPAGADEATLRPGFSVGHIDVEGNYQQGAKGTMLLDVSGGTAGQFDTIDVTGEATLDGKLVVDASAFTNPTPGTTVTIITAEDGVTPGARFRDVVTVGANNLYFAPTYLVDHVEMTGYLPGDMNRSGSIDSGDVNDFALGLMNQDAYWGQRFIYPVESGDMDNNNRFDFDDIDEFAALLQQHGVPNALAAIERALAAVPEPGTMALLTIGAIGSIATFLDRRRPAARAARGTV